VLEMAVLMETAEEASLLHATCAYPWCCCWCLLLCFSLIRLSFLLHKEVGCQACHQTQQPS